MKRVVLPAFAAAMLAIVFATPVAAAVVYEASGQSTDLAARYEFVGAGTYDFEIFSSRDLSLISQVQINTHYDLWLAPPPKPHSEVLTGRNSMINYNVFLTGTYLLNTVTVPEDVHEFVLARDVPFASGIFPPETLLYQEYRYEIIIGQFTIYPNSFEPFDYTLRITKRDDVPPPSGPIPEPSTWALLILGFAGAGAMLRAQLPLAGQRETVRSS